MPITIEQILLNDKRARDAVNAAREYRKAAEADLIARENKLSDELSGDVARRVALDAEQREKKLTSESEKLGREIERLEAQMNALYASKKDEWVSRILAQVTEVK